MEESNDLQKVSCSEVSKKRGDSFTAKLRNTVLPELQYKCDAQVVFLDLASIWSTNNMSNDKCIDSLYKATQCPISLNCKFLSESRGNLDCFGDTYSIHGL